MRRRTLEEKLEAIRLVEAGNSARSVSDRLHIGHHQIYEWLYIYKEKGVCGLENKRICDSRFSALIPRQTDLKRFILGTYTDPNEIHKRPLTKLAIDLAKQLGWM